MEVVKAAEGRTDFDSGMMAQADTMPPPGDVEVEKMSEPTQEQKMNFAAPQGYEHPPPQPPRPGSQGAYSAGYGAGGAGYQHPGAESAYGAGAYQNPARSGTSSAANYGVENVAHQHPARTDSGFAAPPPGPPPHRTDSGFPAPPGPPPSQGKQDPDGPPRYA